MGDHEKRGEREKQGIPNFSITCNFNTAQVRQITFWIHNCLATHRIRYLKIL
jgi:hypothetical protein